MDENLRPENFERVWARVSGAPAALRPSETAEQELLRHLETTDRLLGLYCKLLRRTTGRCRQRLPRLLAEVRRQLRLLQMEYFLRTGETFAGGASGDAAEGTLTTLRRIILAEEQLSGAFASAAEDRSGALGALYGQLAQGAADRARALRDVAEQYFI